MLLIDNRSVELEIEILFYRVTSRYLIFSVFFLVFQFFSWYFCDFSDIQADKICEYNNEIR